MATCDRHDGQSESRKRYRIAYLVTHPIQYQAPLLRFLNAQPDIEVTTFFQSDVSVTGYHDQGFGRSIAWDVPLLDGYPHEFLPSFGRRDLVGRWRPLSYGIGTRLKQGDFDLLWVHGYARWFNWVAMAAARRLGIATLVRDEATPYSAPRSPMMVALKRHLFFRHFNRLCSGYLAIGSLNRQFFLQNDAPDGRVFVAPYCVDNQYFRARAREAEPRRAAMRAELGLQPGRAVILYASKFEGRKRAADLLAAYAKLIERAEECRRPYLLFVGDGEERKQVERDAGPFGKDVQFLGFRNQSELPAFFDLCDVFVLASQFEPWGLVINEVMSVGRAVVVSDHVGCGPDLVRDGVNGHVVPLGDVDALADALRDILRDDARIAAMGDASLRIVDQWGFDAFLTGFRAALACLLPDRTPKLS
jgi:glycosyltransferase involved in cell wall biosynthesis